MTYFDDDEFDEYYTNDPVLSEVYYRDDIVYEDERSNIIKGYGDFFE